MAVKYTSDPTYTNPYGIPAQEADVARSKKLIEERKANEAQLIQEQSKYSRQEQKRLEAEAAAAAAAGSPDAASKQAAAKQYADTRASIAADLEQNGRLLNQTQQGLQEHEATLARMQATEASTPPNTKIVNAGSDSAAQSPPTVPTLNETTPAANTANPVATPNTTAAAIPSGVFAPTPDPVPPSNSPYASQRAQQIDSIQAATPQPPDQTDAETARLARQEQVAADAPTPVDPRTSPYGSQRAQQNEQIAAAAPEDVDPANDPNQSAAETARLARGEGAAAANAAEAENNALAAAGAALKQQAQEQAAVQAEFQSPASGDWRVRLRLAPGAKYLYMDDNNTLLKPLKASGGVVFPYMPTIQTTYNANYESVELTHSNYRGQFYKSSYVGDVQITGTFTAQDTAEANYLLAVIHFFRSVTKMFYGAKDPLRGAPPPLVYLIGLGQYQFNNQPCVVKTFNYSMPNDCDYIRTKPNNYNTNLGGRSPKPQASNDPVSSVVNRLKNALLPQGAVPNVPAQSLLDMQSVTNIADSTYVPTKCEIQLTLMPIQTRSQQSQQFSMEAFANGNLLKGGFW